MIRLARKMAFLVASGLPEQDAQMAMPAAGRFTVGSVLEKQDDTGPGDSADHAVDLPPIGHESAFEAGLALILDGLAHRLPAIDT